MHIALATVLMCPQITREAGPVKGGSTVIAFAKDPTGYMWELIQRKETQEPLCQVRADSAGLTRR